MSSYTYSTYSNRFNSGSYGTSYRPRESSLGPTFGASGSIAIPVNYYSSSTLGSRGTASPPVLRRNRNTGYGSSDYDTGGGGGNRNSMLLTSSGLGSETARYNRQEAIKEIHNDFMRKFEADQKRYWPSRDASVGGYRTGRADSTDRDSWITGRARQGNVLGVDEIQSRKDIVNDMYHSAQFSSRTLDTVSKMVDQAPAKRKEDYKWRKDMEQFENSDKFKRDTLVRNIESRTKKRKEREEKLDAWKPPIEVPGRVTRRDKFRAEVRQRENKENEEAKPASTWRSSMIYDTVSKPEEEPKTSSWRDRLNMNEVKEEKAVEEPKTSWRDRINMNEEKEEKAEEEPKTSWRDRINLEEPSIKPAVTKEEPKASWRSRLDAEEEPAKPKPEVKVTEESKKSSWRSSRMEVDANNNKSEEPKSSWKSLRQSMDEADAKTKKEDVAKPVVAKTETKTEKKTVKRTKVSKKTDDSAKSKKTEDSPKKKAEKKKAEPVPAPTPDVEMKEVKEEPKKEEPKQLEQPPQPVEAKPMSAFEKRRLARQKQREEQMAKIESGEIKLDFTIGEEGQDGSKSLKSCLDAVMGNLEQEMEEGRGKLARLRERIKKAKGVIQETDQALANAAQG